MKQLLLVALLLSAVGCTSKTEYGPCIGVGDERDPKKVYKVSTNNVIVGTIFIETVVAPVVVVLDEFYCPIGNRK